MKRIQARSNQAFDLSSNEILGGIDSFLDFHRLVIDTGPSILKFLLQVIKVLVRSLGRGTMFAALGGWSIGDTGGCRICMFLLFHGFFENLARHGMRRQVLGDRLEEFGRCSLARGSSCIVVRHGDVSSQSLDEKMALPSHLLPPPGDAESKWSSIKSVMPGPTGHLVFPGYWCFC